MSRRTTYANCTLCEATCGIEVVSEGRQVIDLRGDPRDSFSSGHVCPKAIGLSELQSDPNRLRRPLRRKGNGFEEIGWEEAYALAADGLARVRQSGGADSVGVYRGNPTIHDFATLLGVNVVSRLLGTRNLFSAGSTDTWPRYVQSASMYGGPLRATVPDIDRTDYLLVVGANPLVSNGSLLTAPGIRDRLAAIRERGGKLVVIDPRRTQTARKADEHQFITPGTDAAMLLAMVHVIVAEERVAFGSCEELVNGFEEAVDVAARFSPERVAPFCGIDAAIIRRLAREFSDAPSAAAYGRMGTCVQEFGTLASWALDLLAAFTGNLDRPGGSMFASPAAPLHPVFEADGPVTFGRWQSRVSGLDEVTGEFPAKALAEEIETPGEGQIRALLTIAGNPVLTYPNSERLDRALESLDFMVSLDYYLNETTRHADLVLPPTGPLERGHYDLALNHFAVRKVAKWSNPVFEADPASRDGWTSLIEISRRLIGDEPIEADVLDGLVLRQFTDMALAASRWSDELSPEDVLEGLSKDPGPERILDVILRLGPFGDGFGLEPGGLSLAEVKRHEHGMDLGPMVPVLPGSLATASGKIELAPQRILADVARLEASIEAAGARTLRLINRRDIRSMNSWLHNLPALAKGRDRCTLQMHPDDAAARGLESGGVALVRSRVGEVRAPVEVTTDVMPGVVSLPHGFGHSGEGIVLDVATRKPGVNVNAITDDVAMDAPSGASALFGGPVEVLAVP